MPCLLHRLVELGSCLPLSRVPIDQARYAIIAILTAVFPASASKNSHCGGLVCRFGRRV